MYESKLEENGNHKYLTVYYNPELKNWNETIERALSRHKLKAGECGILCLPMTQDSTDRLRGYE